MTHSEMNEVHPQAPSRARALRGAAAGRGTARDLVESPYPPFVSRAIHRFALTRVTAGNRALERVREAQETTLLSLLRHAEGTEYGRARGFSTIRSYEAFARQ